MRVTALTVALGAAAAGVAASPIRRHIRASRVVRLMAREFPATTNHSQAPAFGEAVKRCADGGMSVPEILVTFTPQGLAQSDQMIVLHHMEAVARVYAPRLVNDIRAEIGARVPNDTSSLYG